MNEELDLLIKNACIIDGTGNPYYKAEIGIRNGRIVDISRIIKTKSKRSIDAQGLTVSPGFFDSHSHDDSYLLTNPLCPEKILQGVTTDVIGNCGISLAPISEIYREKYIQAFGVLTGGYLRKDLWGLSSFESFLNKIEQSKPSLNVVPLVGHGAIRIAVMGLEKRPPSVDEMNQMKAHTAEAMNAGAFGLSTALILVPASFATTEEMIELTKVVKKYNGIYVTHMRSESDNELEALEETFNIGRSAGVPVHISHYKIAGKENWGRSDVTNKMLADARNSGLEVSCDQYPYSAASLFLSAALPPSIQSKGPEYFADRLRDVAYRKEVIKEIEKSSGGIWENLIKNCGFDGIIIAGSKYKSDYIGKSLAQIGSEENRNPYEVFFDLIVQEKTSTIVILKMMNEKDVKKIMQSPFTMVGTDGLPSFGKPNFHPRMTGTFPRILGRYVRQEKVISLEDAIRKMTSLPAQTFGISNKGLLKTGFDADIVIFDSETVLDTSTYEDPSGPPEGIKWVLVNGEISVENGSIKGTTSGRVLRNKPSMKEGN